MGIDTFLKVMELKWMWVRVRERGQWFLSVKFEIWIFAGKFANFREEDPWNTYISWYFCFAEWKTLESLNVCLCMSAIFFLLLFLLFLLNQCFFPLYCCWCWCCFYCCCYSLEPKIIFDYRSIHKVKGKENIYSNNGSLVCILFAKVNEKPNV